MKLVITSGKNLKKEIDVDYTPDKLTRKINDYFLESIETQLNMSIDYILNGDEATLMCDSGINPMKFEFLCEIVQRNL